MLCWNHHYVVCIKMRHECQTFRKKTERKEWKIAKPFENRVTRIRRAHNNNEMMTRAKDICEMMANIMVIIMMFAIDIKSNFKHEYSMYILLVVYFSFILFLLNISYSYVVRTTDNFIYFLLFFLRRRFVFLFILLLCVLHSKPLNWMT